jgi:hypothetical protein
MYNITSRVAIVRAVRLCGFATQEIGLGDRKGCQVLTVQANVCLIYAIQQSIAIRLYFSSGRCATNPWYLLIEFVFGYLLPQPTLVAQFQRGTIGRLNPASSILIACLGNPQQSSHIPTTSCL